MGNVYCFDIRKFTIKLKNNQKTVNKMTPNLHRRKKADGKLSNPQKNSSSLRKM